MGRFDYQAQQEQDERREEEELVQYMRSELEAWLDSPEAQREFIQWMDDRRNNHVG